MKKLKVYRIIQICIYCALAVLTAVFHNQILHVLQYFIGALMIFYGLEAIAFTALKEKKHYSVHYLYWNAVEILLGLVLIVFLKEPSAYATVCVIWSTWSILRETKELAECTEHFKKKISAIPSIIESLVVIVFSILLIINPTEHHASIHLYLLVAELLTKALFPLLDQIKISRPQKTPKQIEAPITETEEPAVCSENDSPEIVEESAVADESNESPESEEPNEKELTE